MQIKSAAKKSGSKKKAAPKASKKSASAKQSAENKELQESKDKAVKVAEKQNRDAEEATKRERETREEAEALEPKDGDEVMIDVDGVPEGLHTVPLMTHLKLLRDAGMQGLRGRVTGSEDSPAGKVYSIDGATFSHKVPAVAVHKVGPTKRAEAAPAKKRVRKSRAKK